MGGVTCLPGPEKAGCWRAHGRQLSSGRGHIPWGSVRSEHTSWGLAHLPAAVHPALPDAQKEEGSYPVRPSPHLPPTGRVLGNGNTQTFITHAHIVPHMHTDTHAHTDTLSYTQTHTHTEKTCQAPSTSSTSQLMDLISGEKPARPEGC